MEGDFVTKFGRYGKKLGEMMGPSDISVLKSGHFAVVSLKTTVYKFLNSSGKAFTEIAKQKSRSSQSTKCLQ